MTSIRLATLGLLALSGSAALAPALDAHRVTPPTDAPTQRRCGWPREQDPEEAIRNAARDERTTTAPAGAGGRHGRTPSPLTRPGMVPGRLGDLPLEFVQG